MSGYKTRVNQPDRVFLSSSDDVTNSATSRFDRFEIRLATPILEAKRAQLLRATIPNAMVNIPDYALVFYYLRSYGGATTVQAVRIMPSNWISYNSSTYNMPINTYYSTPYELVNALNQASANDSTTFNSNFVANDCVFGYNSTTKKITFSGTNSTYFYCPLGYNSTRTLPTLTVPNFDNTSSSAQPFLANYYLNLRLGYAIPTELQVSGATNYQYNQQGGKTIIFDSYPNLVFTQCYFLYSSIVAGSSLGSNGTHNLLSVVPCSSAQLAITNYTALTLNWLTKVPDNIY